MSVPMTAIFPAAVIVRDSEFWFLREMLVAPVGRSAIVIGKCRESLSSLWLACRMSPMTPLRY